MKPGEYFSLLGNHWEKLEAICSISLTLPSRIQYFKGEGVTSQIMGTKCGPYLFNQLLSKNWRMWQLTKRKWLNKYLTRVLITICINDFMWKGPKDKSLLPSKAHETLYSICGSNPLCHPPSCLPCWAILFQASRPRQLFYPFCMESHSPHFPPGSWGPPSTLHTLLFWHFLGHNSV